jgi:AcrR family transcriptional regulator
VETTTDTLSQSQQARRDRVVQAALRLGRDGGYDAVQMRDVANGAGVALGTIYRYFSSKDHLLAAALVWWVEDLESRVNQRPPTGDTATARVLSVLRRAHRAMENEPLLSEAVVTALVSPDAGAAECQRQVTVVMNRTIGGALPSHLSDAERSEMSRMLGHVWFSSLIGWVNGWSGIGHVSDEVELACHLMLDHLDR